MANVQVSRLRSGIDMLPCSARARLLIRINTGSRTVANGKKESSLSIVAGYDTSRAGSLVGFDFRLAVKVVLPARRRRNASRRQGGLN